jgi:hypothetical protein
MGRIYLRPYGAEATINFELFEVDGIDFRTDAVHASGDTKISKDEGEEANTANGFVDEGQGYSLTLSASELTAARIAIYIVDQTATKVWLDCMLIVETYGNASAMHPNLGVAMRGTNGANTTTPPTAVQNREEMDSNSTQLSGIKANTDNLPSAVKKNTALAGFMFFMRDSTDRASGKTGLTITSTRSIGGGPLAATTNSATEISGGWYKIDLSAADLNGDVIALNFAGTDADTAAFTIVTKP